MYLEAIRALLNRGSLSHHMRKRSPVPHFALSTTIAAEKLLLLPFRVPHFPEGFHLRLRKPHNFVRRGAEERAEDNPEYTVMPIDNSGMAPVAL